MKAILEAAARLSGVTKDELVAWRASAITETGDDYLRPIREYQLASWTSSSTPITQQITNSEQHLDKLLEAAMPEIRTLLPRLFAIERKQYRIDKLKEEYAAQRASSLSNGSGGLHEDYVTLAKLLQRLGAGPSKVRQWAIEDLIIIADLARWKAADARYEDADNPWLAVRALYAARTIEKVGKNDRAGAKSVPGAPPPDGRWTSSIRYWRFGGVADQTAAAPPANNVAKPQKVEAEAVLSPHPVENSVAAATISVGAAAEASRQVIDPRDTDLPDMLDTTDEIPTLAPASPANEVHMPTSTSDSNKGALVNQPAGLLLSTGQMFAEPNYGLSDDISPEAAAAYYDLARRLAIELDDWWKITWPSAKADESEPVSISLILRGLEKQVSCPLLSGPSTMTVWIKEGTTNAFEEAQAGGDHRQAA